MSSLPRPREIVASLISSIQHPHQQENLDHSTNPLINAPQPIQKALLTLHVLFPNELLPALDLLDRNLITRLTTNTTTDHQHEAQNPTNNPRTLPRPQNRTGNLRHLPQLPPPQPLPEETPVQISAQPQTAAQLPHPQSPHHHDLQNLGRQIPPLRQEGSETGDPAHAWHADDAGVYVVRSGQLPSRLRGLRDQTTMTASYEVRLKAWSCSCPAFAFAAFPAVAVERTVVEDLTDERAHDSRRSSWRFGGLTLGSDLPVCKHLVACALVQQSSVFAGFVEEREVSVEELAGWAAGWGD